MSTALLTPTTGSRYAKTSAEARPNRLPLAYKLSAASMLTVGAGVCAAVGASALWVVPTVLVAVPLLIASIMLAVRSAKPAKPNAIVMAYLGMFVPWGIATMQATTIRSANLWVPGLAYAFAGLLSGGMLLGAALMSRAEQKPEGAR